MKTYLIILLFILMSSAGFSQWVPADIENALSRIENSIRKGNPSSIEDMLTNGMTIRLEDSLYQSISGIQALNVLNQYFENKQNITFRFTTPGDGKMIYTENGKQDTVNVDVWLRRSIGGPIINAINISNYPIATVFFDIPRNKK